MRVSSSAHDSIALEAAEWFCRIQSPTLDDDERVTFSEWLIRSPVHIEEFLAVSATWGLIDANATERFAMDALIEAARHEDRATNVLKFRAPTPAADTASSTKVASPRPRRGWIFAAAAMVLTIGAGVSYHAWRQMPDFSTAKGEQRRIGLADGSVLFLDTNSKVRLRWTEIERRIELMQGEARFEVAKNPARPFIVATPEATVRAVGTVFKVAADTRVTQITVIEGRVNVRTNDPPPRWFRVSDNSGTRSKSSIELSAGENAAVDSTGKIIPNSGPPGAAGDARTVRHLVFRDETLNKVVADFNRYQAVRMVVDDPQLGSLKINGIFDSNDPETLVAYLKTFETVQTHIAADGSVHLSLMPGTKPAR